MIDWPYYNQSLVRRGQVLLDFDVLDGWNHELSQMNQGKVGAMNKIFIAKSRNVFPKKIISIYLTTTN